MEPLLKPNDKLLFYKLLDNCNYYLEYGSGGSTYQASLKKNIKKIYSIESDIQWQNNLKKNTNNNKVNFIYIDMKTSLNNWGYPGKDATNEEKINYSEQIKLIDKDIINKLDLILIDGRFRVACCLKCHEVINNNTLIAFDDFKPRFNEYSEVLNYFDIVDKTSDNNMYIFKKKENIVPKEIIKKYELDAR
jgi:hypothetical protein